jgi:putative aldouronate transport system substrate-binding protein
MYLLGEKSKDFDAVYDKINEIMKAKINATVEASFLSWAEHDTKYSLLFSGNEDFDLIFTAATWGHYETTVALGGFYPLSFDFIKQYAPDIYEVVPPVAWDQAEIGGSIYMVPQYNNEFTNDAYAVRGDLMEKYGYSTISGFDQLTEFFSKLAAGESGVSPRGNIQGGMIYEYFQKEGYSTLPGTPKEFFLYKSMDVSDTSINYLLEWDKFEEYCYLMKDFYEQGFWSKDSLASMDQRQDGLLRGTSATMAWNLGSCKTYATEANLAHPDWNVTLVDIIPDIPKQVSSYINNGMAINANSKNKERAMMALNLFYTDKEIHDLAFYGIEGVHWKAIGDDAYSTTDRTGDYGISANCNWAWNNMNINRDEYIENPTPADIKFQEILDSWNGNIRGEHPLDGFSFDKASVTNELALIDSLVAQYYTPLLSGMVDDVPKAIAELKKQVENAGIQKVHDEFKAQVAAHIAAQS